MRTLVPSLDASVFAVLVKVQVGISLAQLARMAPRGSRNGLMAVLERQVRDGLVIAEPSNTGSLYRVNRLHVLYPAIELAFLARRETIERIGLALSKMMPAPLHASLFGSFARQEGGPDSDIDVLIVTHDTLDVASDAWLDQLRVLGDQVLAWTGNPLEVVVLPLAKFHSVVRNQEPIVESWQLESVHLSGRSLTSIVMSGLVMNGDA